MAAKRKVFWCCNECGGKQLKWMGQCPACKAWNTLSEEIEWDLPSRFQSTPTVNKPLRIKEIPIEEHNRSSTGMSEVDRLVGGGITPGSFTLIGGEPGIGKSTLLLQLANQLAKAGATVLYICGEESVAQTSMRARRLNVDSDNLLFLSELQVGAIKRSVEEINPDILIVDSIQIVYKEEIPSAPGSVVQVREAATEFMHLAKSRAMSTFLVGHVTKSGEIAGPRVLEHLVDTVLYFEGERHNQFRLLRVVKNRFGPTDEVAVFQMHTHGLEQVANPSALFLEERSQGMVGSVILPTMEGSRVFLVEVQALVSHTMFPSPSRRSTGIDGNRLALLLAVLEKRLNYPLYQRDVFVSMAGGLRITEPAIDLGVVLAIASSFQNASVDPHTVVIGEVGLTGEVRSVHKLEQRLKEAVHMGFKRVLLPKHSLKGLSKEWEEKIKLCPVERVEDAIAICWG